jgi:hypothetical protein
MDLDEECGYARHARPDEGLAAVECDAGSDARRADWQYSVSVPTILCFAQFNMPIERTTSSDHFDHAF